MPPQASGGSGGGFEVAGLILRRKRTGNQAAPVAYQGRPDAKDGQGWFEQPHV